MPLHLLGKKSWNVYNADNIARVRRDEAAAKAAEEAEEQHMQEIDAQRRLAILRGEVPPPLEDANAPSSPQQHEIEGSKREQSHRGDYKRKRKRHGEDDTDFELRLAQERDGHKTQLSLSEPAPRPSSSAPIVDHAGHIDLFGNNVTRGRVEKNQEAEKEAAEKKKEYEDQYTMRFANAAGKDAPKAGPWYSQRDSSATTTTTDQPLKNVWGKDDPRRREREAQRTSASDPLAMMKKGASKVRELKQERKKFQEERAAELDQLRREERRQDRRHGRRHSRRRRSRSPSRGRRDVDSGGRRRRSRDGHDDDRERRQDRKNRDEADHRRRRSRSPDSKRRHHAYS